VYTGTLTLLPDGTVLATGGRAGDGHALANAEIYDPDTGTFRATGRMATPRSGNTATLLNDGRVLIAGGWDGVGGYLASAELYDPSTGTFNVTGDMSSGGLTRPRFSLTAGFWSPDQILMVLPMRISLPTFTIRR
jgi:hypothetical protein